MRIACRSLLAAAPLLVATGCVERYLEIDSNPTGARIAVNGREVGVAPVTLPFAHYGTFRIDAWLPDRPGATQFATVEAPWYQRFPIDLFSELLDPVTHVDRRAVVVEFAGDEASSRHELLERAEALRRESR